MGDYSTTKQTGSLADQLMAKSDEATIPDVIDELERYLSMLHEQISETERVLSPVLKPEFTGIDLSDKEDMPPISGMNMRIRRLATQLREAHDRLRDITSRVDF